MNPVRNPYKKILYVAYVATSIDGRIAQNNHSGTDWTSKEDWNFFQQSLKKIDAVIVGHATFKVAESRLRRRNAIVITSKVHRPKTEARTVFFNPRTSNLKNFLRKKHYKTVAILGGSQIYDYCLRHNMLDEFYVTIEPYVFTAGVPMFQGGKFKKYKFSLISVKKLNKSGTLLLKYKYGN